jgi:hypothetical protein
LTESRIATGEQVAPPIPAGQRDPSVSYTLPAFMGKSLRPELSLKCSLVGGTRYFEGSSDFQKLAGGDLGTSFLKR